MGCCFRMIQYILVVTLVSAIALVVTAGAVDYWWVHHVWGAVYKNGLWRRCVSTQNVENCVKRDDLFQFSAFKDRDIVLTALAVGACCFLTSFLLILSTICQKYPSKCLVLVETIVTFLGTGAAVSSVAWAIFEISKKNHSWAFYLMYTACGAGLISFLFSLVLLCVRAPGAYRATRRDDEIVMLSR